MADNKSRNTSPANDKMLDASEAPVILGDAPGTSSFSREIDLSELGKLSEKGITSVEEKSGTEETGEYVVVLADVLSGVGENYYHKGDIVQMSQIIVGYTDPETTEETIQNRVLHFLNSNAIRTATPREIKEGKVEVAFGPEPKSVQDERAENQRLAEENRKLQLQLSRSIDASAKADPSVASKSGAAVAASGDKKDDENEEDNWG